jgi:uncharacterized protein involved in cysteine biosynthesis
MENEHIELKQRRELGDIITIYFEFFKKNLKGFLNIFISYNGIFILGFLGVSYLLVTGFVGVFRDSQIAGSAQEMESTLYIGFGSLGFVLLFLATAILNYSLAASYIINYEKNEKPLIDKKQVWSLVSNNLARIILFVLLFIGIYLGVAIFGLILSIVPLVGTLAYYVLMLAYTAWMGVSFMVMLYENRGVSDALTEGWHLVKRYFWKSVLVNLVISLLLTLLMLVVLLIPGVLIGVYAFLSLEYGIDLANSPYANIVWTLALSILLIIYSFNQSLSQFINGILYFNLHEETYNETTRKRIDQIGASE